MSRFDCFLVNSLASLIHVRNTKKLLCVVLFSRVFLFLMLVERDTNKTFKPASCEVCRQQSLKQVCLHPEESILILSYN